MKADIHPKYHVIKVVMTNGTEFTTRSTYGEDGATLKELSKRYNVSESTISRLRA